MHAAICRSDGATALSTAARLGLFATLAIIYFWFGGMKFTAYEANGLVSLVSNSPLLSWFYSLLSVRGFSNFLGALEITIGALILAGIWRPLAGVVGGFLSVGLFATTVSFMASTPGTFEASAGGFPAISGSGQFLLKDIGLFAMSAWILADCLDRLRHRA